MSKPPRIKSNALKRALDGDESLFVEPMLDFIKEHGDNAAMITSAEAHDTLVNVLAERPHQERLGEFHASQLRSCHRAQVFQAVSLPARREATPPRLMNIYIDGTWRHVRWQMMGISAGVLSKVEVPVYVPEWRFVGSQDGEGISDDGTYWGWELKGTAQLAGLKKFGPQHSHVWQIHGYFAARPELDCYSLTYECKTTNELLEFVIYPDKKRVRILTETLDTLNGYIANEELPEILDECEHGEGAYKDCPYAYACKQVDWDSVKEAQGCHTAEEVIVRLGLNRRNKHKKRTKPARGQGRGGTPKALRTSRGTLSVHVGVDGA
jgi:hypothetical protein